MRIVIEACNVISTKRTRFCYKPYTIVVVEIETTCWWKNETKN